MTKEPSEAITAIPKTTNQPGNPIKTMSITTEVLEKGPSQFSQMGQFLYTPLRESTGKISQCLAKRLVKYAEVRAKEAGLSLLVQEWRVAVGTIDGDVPSDDRSYYVEWSNAEETKISLVGILIQNGRPTLDHKFEIETD